MSSDERCVARLQLFVCPAIDLEFALFTLVTGMPVGCVKIIVMMSATSVTDLVNDIDVMQLDDERGGPGRIRYRPCVPAYMPRA
jgi:hypothetical protein